MLRTPSKRPTPAGTPCPDNSRKPSNSPGAWLTKVASRICLDLLGSARARRERYVGEWIPEPLPEPTEWISRPPGSGTVDPADRVTLDESVNMAFLVMLESMTPAERVAFILHDVFRYSFTEVAEIVGRDAGGMPPAGLLSPPPHPRVAGSRDSHIGRAPSNVTFLDRAVNGQPGLAAQQDGVTVTVYAFDVAGDRITHIWAVLNPDKLRPWTTG
jgi:hypothetical protein